MSFVKQKLAGSVSIVLILLDLAFLYVIKYKNQSLPITEFSLSNIGNLFNLGFSLFLITGLLIIIIKNKPAPSLYSCLLYTVLLTFFLIVAWLSTLVTIPMGSFYFMGQSFNEIITGVLFIGYQVLFFAFTSSVWLNMWGETKLMSLSSFVNAIIFILLLLFFSFYYSNTIKSNRLQQDYPENHADYAIVLGAAVWSGNTPSPTLASRVDKAADLYKKKIVKKIYLTGSNAPGELSEAQVSLNYIRSKKVDSGDIDTEDMTTSTTEQIRFIKEKILSQEGIKNVIIISDAYHLPRVSEICKFFNLNVSFTASDLNLSFKKKLYYQIRESVALLIFWLFAL